MPPGANSMTESTENVNTSDRQVSWRCLHVWNLEAKYLLTVILNRHVWNEYALMHFWVRCRSDPGTNMQAWSYSLLRQISRFIHGSQSSFQKTTRPTTNIALHGSVTGPAYTIHTSRIRVHSSYTLWAHNSINGVSSATNMGNRSTARSRFVRETIHRSKHWRADELRVKYGVADRDLVSMSLAAFSRNRPPRDGRALRNLSMRSLWFIVYNTERTKALGCQLNGLFCLYAACC